MSYDFIPAAKPIIGDDERAAVDAVLATGMLAQGQQVADFEREFSEVLLDGRSSVAVNSTVLQSQFVVPRHAVQQRFRTPKANIPQTTFERTRVRRVNYHRRCASMAPANPQAWLWCNSTHRRPACFLRFRSSTFLT